MDNVTTPRDGKPSAFTASLPNLLASSRFHAGAETFLLAVLVAIFVWRALVPGWRTLNTDFPNYFLAGQLYHRGYPLDRVYDWIWFQRQEDHAGLPKRIVEFVPTTLLSTLLIVPLASLPPIQAKHWWLGANLFFLAFTGLLLERMTNFGARRIAILLLLCLDPLRTNFLYGQFHLPVLFLLTLAAWMYLEGWPVSAGVTLATASALKIYPILFVFYFLRKKQWRAVAGLVGGTLGLAALSLYLFGLQANRTYVMEILPRIGRGENIDPYSVDWNSLTALLHRLFISEPELNPYPLFNLPVAYAALQPLCQALLFVPFLWLLSPLRAARVREKLEWGAYVVLLLVLSTSTGSYHHCVLILSAVLVLETLLRERRHAQAEAFLVLYILACLPLYRWVSGFTDGWRVFLAFPRLYAMLGLWVLLLLALSSSASRPLSARLKTREALVFAVIFLAFASLGISLAIRHLRGQFNSGISRLAVAPGSSMMAEPSIAEAGTLFTVMRLGAYGMGLLAGKQPVYRAFGWDAFHPASSPGISEAWVELASTTSRIVKIDLAGAELESAPFRLEVEDAEQPQLSLDGKQLAFVREEQGRGTLWVKRLASGGEEGWQANRERKLVGGGYDVLEAAFDPGGREVLFSAFHGGGPSLFVADVASGSIREAGFGARARYPAFSPDGKWLAYSKLATGSWHLWERQVIPGLERRLTDGECNSVSPVWMPDSQSLIFATDCGRGVGLTTLARMKAVP